MLKLIFFLSALFLLAIFVGIILAVHRYARLLPKLSSVTGTVFICFSLLLIALASISNRGGLVGSLDQILFVGGAAIFGSLGLALRKGAKSRGPSPQS